MDLEIRRVRLEDIEDTIDIKISGWQEAYKGIIDDYYLNTILPNERERRIKNWSENYNEGNFIVAVLNNEVVAFSRYIDNNSKSQEQDCDCELMAIYVKPNYKYKGIGSKLFNYIVNDFKNKGKRKMILWCLKDNEPSKKFYTKMGGIIVAEKDAKIDSKIYKEVCFLYNL